MFLETLTAASLAALADGAFAGVAGAQTNSKTSAGSAAQDPFETAQVKVAGNIVFTRRYGKGPAILLVHGFPRASLMWRSIAPKLSEDHTVICVDLSRSFGRGPLRKRVAPDA